MTETGRSEDERGSGVTMSGMEGCFARVIAIAIVGVLGAGAVDLLRKDPRSHQGWFVAVLALAWLAAFVVRRRPSDTEPDEAERRRRTARALQHLSWVQSGVQDSRYPEDVPSKPTEPATKESEPTGE